MGDRANVVIRDQWPDQDEREAVFLYSHWGGYGLPETLRRALDLRMRWDDSSYLARIVFDVMIGDSQGSETGYGIATRMPDNEYDLLVLYKGRVYVLPEAAFHEHGFAQLEDQPSLAFADYVSVEERTWENLAEDAVVVGSV